MSVQLTKHRWAATAVALAIAASAYAAYTAVALYRSFTQLGVGFVAAGAAAPTSEPTPTSLASGAGAAMPKGTAGAGLERTGNPTRALKGVQPPAQRMATESADDATLAQREEDPSILRQRALLDAAANPDLAELLNDPNPEVRKAALGFFEND
jgi:hypothetical protein